MVEWVGADECEAEIKNCFEWMLTNGCRERAMALLDELNLSSRLLEHLQGKKSAYQAKKDGDWEALIGAIDKATTPNELRSILFDHRGRIATLPWTFRESFEEEVAKRKERLEGLDIHD